MKTERKVERVAQKGVERGTGRRKVDTQVKKRCRLTRDPNAYVKRQLEQAIPEIVSAHIEKAKSGSVIHTKWLWGVADKAPVKGKESRSLAEVLLEQLGGCELKR